MMGDHVEGFIRGLIEQTREGKLDWKPFSSFKNRRDILEELENGRGDFDYMRVKILFFTIRRRICFFI